MTRIVSLDAHGTTWILEDAANVARFRLIRSQLRYARSLYEASQTAHEKGLDLAADILRDHARSIRTAIRQGL
jgi:hypothetical protein